MSSVKLKSKIMLRSNFKTVSKFDDLKLWEDIILRSSLTDQSISAQCQHLDTYQISLVNRNQINHMPMSGMSTFPDHTHYSDHRTVTNIQLPPYSGYHIVTIIQWSPYSDHHIMTTIKLPPYSDHRKVSAIQIPPYSYHHTVTTMHNY